MHAIAACMRLPFFKIFSNFIYFCPNFHILSPFCPFSEKTLCMPLLSKLELVQTTQESLQPTILYRYAKILG